MIETKRTPSPGNCSLPLRVRTAIKRASLCSQRADEPLGEGKSRGWVPPRRYPHRAGKTYTVRGFPRVLHNIEKDGKLTDAQRRNLTDLYFGRKYREYLDDEGFYRRSRGMWRVGRLCHYAYRLSGLMKLVERSGIFHCCYNKAGEMVAFRSEATWRLQGGQQVFTAWC